MLTILDLGHVNTDHNFNLFSLDEVILAECNVLDDHDMFAE